MSSTHFPSFLQHIATKPLRVLEPSIPNSKYIPLDLSTGNPLLQNLDFNNVEVLEDYIHKELQDQNGLIAYGGYHEDRAIYKRSRHFNASPETERSIHLGIDLWTAANTPVFCPLDAVVHSFKNNTNFGDYGPTIILKHRIREVDFYTLYGHLSIASLNNLSIGTPLKQGTVFAELGDSNINGHYPPHLHFQIIKDMGAFMGDYPGVCHKDDLAFYLENCPNPELLLKLKSTGF